MDFADVTKMSGVKYCVYKKGEYFFHRGEKLKYVYFLLEGKAAQCIFHENGSEQIYTTLEANKGVRSWVGVFNIFCKDSITNAHLMALTDCRCLRVTTDVYMEHLKNDPDEMVELLKLLMERYNIVAEHLQQRKQHKLPSHIANYILEEAKCVNGEYVVENVKNIEISKFLGIHHVTVSKIMCEFEDMGVLLRNKDKIIITDIGKFRTLGTGEIEFKYNK